MTPQMAVIVWPYFAIGLIVLLSVWTNRGSRASVISAFANAALFFLGLGLLAVVFTEVAEALRAAWQRRGPMGLGGAPSVSVVVPVGDTLSKRGRTRMMSEPIFRPTQRIGAA